VNKANSDKRDNADVLRAGDIVPPYNKKNQPSENITPPVDKKRAEYASDGPAEAADVEHKEGGIPKFDLAKQILAEQRRVTAVRRKAPPKAVPVRGPKEKGYNGAGVSKAGVASPSKKTEPLLVPSEHEQILAEIVARDIERLCGRLDA